MEEVPSTVVLPPELVRRLVARQCVAFVGAGMSAPIGMPGWSGLLSLLVDLAEKSGRNATDKLVTCRAGIAAGEFELVASLVRTMVDEPEITDLVLDVYGNHRLHEAEGRKQKLMEGRLRALVSLPWRGIVTTNYDNLIEEGLTRYSHTRTHSLIEANKRLGSLLFQPETGRMFFVKIHGSVNLGRFVLSTEEYNDVYFKHPRINRFFSALMMTSSILFIGCSLDDQVTQIRRTLTAEFDGHVPLAYAILHASERNLRRAGWLRSAARIEPLFYHDPTHSDVDGYLEQLLIHCDRFLTELPTSEGTARHLRNQDANKRWEEIGEINRQLVLLVRSEGGSIRHRDLMEPVLGRKTSELLVNISSSERIYRTLFLISCGMISESLNSGEKMYLLTVEMQDFLDSMRIS